MMGYCEELSEKEIARNLYTTDIHIENEFPSPPLLNYMINKSCYLMEYLDTFLLQFQGLICRVGIGLEVTFHICRHAFSNNLRNSYHNYTDCNILTDQIFIFYFPINKIFF